MKIQKNEINKTLKQTEKDSQVSKDTFEDEINEENDKIHKFLNF